jgi:hypothetical protein
LAQAIGQPIIQFPLTCTEINNMNGIGDTTIKRSRYRNPLGELGGLKLHRLADAKTNLTGRAC